MDSSILLIDIGNTTIKWQFEDQLQSALIKAFNINQLPKVQRVFVSCVGDKSLLKGLNNVVFVESPREFKQFKSSYQKPTELGVDRFLAMIAAMQYYPNQTILVIDTGSALTFDLILSDGTHQGGLIMPGLAKLRSSFNQFGVNSQQLKSQQLADNTVDAWQLGTGKMFIDAINSQIEAYLDKLSDLRVVLTGGDSKMVALRLNHSVQHHQNLVLQGLAYYAQTPAA